MINYEESYLRNLDFGNTENKITGGYVYNVDSRNKDFTGGYVYEENAGNEEFGGGTHQRVVTVPIGLVVNRHNENIKCHSGEYMGVIGMDRINDFLNLNHKPLKQITRKFKSIINTTRTKKNR
jgi:hypothetical protein